MQKLRRGKEDGRKIRANGEPQPPSPWADDDDSLLAYTNFYFCTIFEELNNEYSHLFGSHKRNTNLKVIIMAFKRLGVSV